MPGKKPMSNLTCFEQQGVKEPGRARQRPSNDKGDDDNAINVDAHQRGGVLVLRNCLHRLAGLGVLHKEVEDGQENTRRQ